MGILDIFNRFKRANKYESMAEDSSDYFQEGEYETWRDNMLANKKPFGMVPLAFDPDITTSSGAKGDFAMWDDDPNLISTNLYTTPERAGLNELFGENPELNYQNPSNVMFPWQPNYPAIYAADKFMNESDKTGKRIMDSSNWFFKQRLNEGLHAEAGGINFPKQGIGVDKYKYKDYLQDLEYNIIPHEFAHDLELDPEIKDILPFPKSKGFNPAEGRYEKVGKGRTFLHDILYNFGPQYADKGIYSENRSDFSGNPIAPQDIFALDRNQAMNYHALQNFARKTLNKNPNEVVPNSSFRSWANQARNKTDRPSMRDVAGRRRGFNTGGIASLVL